MSIINKLHQAINNSSTKTISIPIVMECILNSFVDLNGTSLENTEYYNLYKNSDISNIIARSSLRIDNWNIDELKIILGSDINYFKLEDEIRHLYNKSFPDSSDNESLPSMISKLGKLHFLGETNTDLLFPIYKRKNSSQYSSWKEKEDELIHLMDNTNIIFLTGNAGSGKNMLVTEVLENYTSNYHDYYFSYYNSDIYTLTNHIEKIHFLTGKYDSTDLQSKLEYLNMKPKTSVLVIEMPIIHAADFEFIRNYLLNLKMRVIILTRHANISKEFISLNINNRPLKNLFKICNSINQIVNFTEEEFCHLCNIINHNPLIITLVARTLRARPELKQSVLDAEKWLWYETNLPKIHSNYHDQGNKSPYKITTLLSRMIDIYPIEKMNFISEISIWTRHPIDRKLLETHFEKIHIDTALSYGILQYYDRENEKLFVPSIIADIIWNNYPIDYEDYRNTIMKFLNALKTGTTIPIPFQDLYPIILNLVLRFHFQITTTPSRLTAKDRQQIEDWNNILFEIIQCLLKLGNYTMAQSISHYYFHYRKKGKTIEYKTAEGTWLQKLINAQINYKNDLNPFNFAVEMQNLLSNLTMPSTKFPVNGFTLLKLIPYLQTNLDHILGISRLNALDSFKYSQISNKKMDDIILLYIKAILEFLSVKEPNLFYYYNATYYLIQSVYSSSSDKYINNKEMAYKYMTYLKKNKADPLKNQNELFIKICYMSLFYDIIYFIKAPDFQHTSIWQKQLEYLITLYNQLYQATHDRIFSWETKEIMYECCILLAFYPVNPILRRCIKDSLSLNQCGNFIEYQIDLDYDKKKELLGILEILSNNIPDVD